MKRTTVLLPDDLANFLDRERRRGVSLAEIIREALVEHFNMSSTKPRRLGIIGLGRSDLPDLGTNDEQYLAEAWGSAEFYEETMGHPPPEPSGREDAAHDGLAAADRGIPTNGAAKKANAVVADESEQSA